MRVALSKTDLKSPQGAMLLDLCMHIAADGRLTVDEIKALRDLLKGMQGSEINAVPYLTELLRRIIADKVIDRDELLELQLAIEKVIPASQRAPIVQARKKVEAEKRERRRAAEAEERKREMQNAMRLRHVFSKVVGVSFQNDDGVERQSIIRNCRPGEQLILNLEPDNQYSPNAIMVQRRTHEQIGYLAEHLAERVLDERHYGFDPLCVTTAVTGGEPGKPTRGVNIVVFFVAKGVPMNEVNVYAKKVLDERT